MRKILGIVLVMVLLASAVPLAVTFVAAYEYEIFGDINPHDDRLTKDELVNVILPYMLDEGDLKLDDVGDASYVYAYWEGEPKEIIDQYDRNVMLYRPTERIVCPSIANMRVIIHCGGLDKFVGSSAYVEKYADNMIAVTAHPKLKELPFVGYTGQGNYELMTILKPDVIVTSSGYADATQEATGVPIVSISSPAYYDAGSFDGYRTTGKVIGKEEETDELISFIQEEFEKITEVTSQIPEDEKPKVYLAFWCRQGITKTPGNYEPVEIAGGRNVAKEHMGGSSVTVLKEQIIDWCPDIILIHSGSKQHRVTIEDVLSDPELATLNATKNGNVNYTKGYYISWDPATGVTESIYMAKLFHPDKFKDLDVEREGNRILKRFYGVDGLYTWMQEHCDFYKWE